VRGPILAIKCPSCHADNPETVKFCGECGTPLPLDAARASVTRTLETTSDELTRGMLFAGRYEVIEELGTGGMGRVYRVHDTKLNEEVALKLIRPEIASGRGPVERFRNEIKIARKIAHPNVCRVHDLHEEGKTLFLTMEYVRGEDLKSLIHRTKALTVGSAVSYARQVAEGLTEAHKLGIVHRDLKPGNIMIDKDGQAKIMDFGIARVKQEKGITGEGAVIGTPEYMSPEQVEGKEADPSSDIYALGVILFEMVVGSPPFEGETPFSIANKHRSEPAPDPRALNPQIPGGLSRLILRCLEKDTAQRYQSAEELHADLERVEAGLPTTERVEAKRKPLTSREITVKFNLKKLVLPLSAVAVLVVAAVILWKFIPHKRAPADAPKIEKSVAVISFENQTGDKTYDYLSKVIPNLLISGLEQAGGVYVVSWERLEDLLKQLGRPEARTIDKELGFRLCRLEGVESIVLGSFVKAETTFVTDVKVLDVESKAILTSASARGEGEASILKSQIDELRLSIAEKLGLAKQKMDLEKLRVSGVTTDSMEAYRAYLEGSEEVTKSYYQKGAEDFEKAVALDPQFASAYLSLGLAYYALGRYNDGSMTIEKAYLNASKATEKERLYIEAWYGHLIEKSPEKFFDTLQVLSQKYPKEKSSYNNSGWLYFVLGKNQESVQMYQKALALDPEFVDAHYQIAYAYINLNDYDQATRHLEKYASLSPREPDPLNSLGDVHLAMGKLDDAQAYYLKAVALKPDFYLTYPNLAYVYALKEDYPKALDLLDRHLAEASAPANQLAYHHCKEFYSFWLGRLDLCLSHLQKATEIAAAQGIGSPTVQENFMKSLYYYKMDKLDVSREANNAWFEASKSLPPDSQKSLQAWHECISALIDIKERNIQSAKTRLAEVRLLIPSLPPDDNTMWVEHIADLLEAEILLQENKYDQALAIIDKAHRPPSYRPTPSWNPLSLDVSERHVLRNDVKARILEEKGDLDRAISEYERLTKFDPKSEDRCLLIDPKYYYRLAGLYERKCLKAKARNTLKRFLTLWKDADPGLPELEDAKARLAKLGT
jgi:serine/threonine protein kinase/tetratricopeptide (TPR) repeat protein